MEPGWEKMPGLQIPVTVPDIVIDNETDDEIDDGESDENRDISNINNHTKTYL